jgi:hypothetical protein
MMKAFRDAAGPAGSAELAAVAAINQLIVPAAAIAKPNTPPPAPADEPTEDDETSGIKTKKARVCAPRAVSAANVPVQRLSIELELALIAAINQLIAPAPAAAAIAKPNTPPPAPADEPTEDDDTSGIKTRKARECAPRAVSAANVPAQRLFEADSGAADERRTAPAYPSAFPPEGRVSIRKIYSRPAETPLQLPLPRPFSPWAPPRSSRPAAQEADEEVPCAQPNPVARDIRAEFNSPVRFTDLRRLRGLLPALVMPEPLPPAPIDIYAVPPADTADPATQPPTQEAPGPMLLSAVAESEDAAQAAASMEVEARRTGPTESKEAVQAAADAHPAKRACVDPGCRRPTIRGSDPLPWQRQEIIEDLTLHCPSHELSELADFVKGACRLKRLHLSRTRTGTLAALAPHVPVSVETLQLCHQEATSADLQCLVNRLPLLKTFMLHDVTGVVGTAALIGALPVTLECLCIVDTPINLDCLRIAVAHYFANLRLFRVTGDKSYYDASAMDEVLVAISQRAKRPTRVVVSRCTEKGVRAMAKGADPDVLDFTFTLEGSARGLFGVGPISLDAPNEARIDSLAQELAESEWGPRLKERPKELSGTYIAGRPLFQHPVYDKALEIVAARG